MHHATLAVTLSVIALSQVHCRARAPQSVAPDRSPVGEGPAVVSNTQAPAAGASDPLGPPESFDLPAIDRYISARVERDAFIGLSVAIMRAGEVVWARGYGLSSIEAATPVTPETPFAIASVSKQFTCATALLVEHEGKVKLDDPVAEYYPNLTRAQDISLMDGLHHVSGYSDYYPLDFVTPYMRAPTTVEAVVQSWAGKALDFEPRSRWSYSNTGYLLVGRVLERQTGQSLAEAMATRIFRPLQMQHTQLGAASLPPGAATGYHSFALGEPEPAPREAVGWLHAAAGVWSTPSDLMRWNLALVDGKILEPEAYQRMVSPPQLSDGRHTSYGCGLGIGDHEGEPILSHGGSINGYLTSNIIVPRLRSAVVVMSNNYQASPSSLARELLDLVIRADRPSPPVPQVDGPAPAEQAALLFSQMQNGRVEAGLLSSDFQAFLTPERVSAAAPRLRALGQPDSIEVTRVSERGGMEVSRLKFHFADRSIQARMFRSVDGIVHEFIISE